MFVEFEPCFRRHGAGAGSADGEQLCGYWLRSARQKSAMRVSFYWRAMISCFGVQRRRRSQPLWRFQGLAKRFLSGENFTSTKAIHYETRSFSREDKQKSKTFKEVKIDRPQSLGKRKPGVLLCPNKQVGSGNFHPHLTKYPGILAAKD